MSKVIKTAPKQALQYKTFAVVNTDAGAEADSPVENTLLHWNFSSLSNEDLIELSAQVNSHVKKLEKWLEAAKLIEKARFRPQDWPEEDGEYIKDYKAEFKGSQGSIAVFSGRSRTALDTERIKIDMPQEWIDEYSKTTYYTEVRFKEPK